MKHAVGAGVGAHGEERSAEHVEGLGLRVDLPGVGDNPRIAHDVQGQGRGIGCRLVQLLVGRVDATLHVQVHGGRRVRVLSAQLADALLVVLGVPVAVQDGVVLVVADLLPGSEGHLSEGPVRQTHAHGAAERIEGGGDRHAHLDDLRLILVVVGRREEGLVAPDGVVLVVYDHAAQTDPTRV